jgi:hypothetical protein
MRENFAKRAKERQRLMITVDSKLNSAQYELNNIQNQLKWLYTKSDSSALTDYYQDMSGFLNKTVIKRQHDFEILRSFKESLKNNF